MKPLDDSTLAWQHLPGLPESLNQFRDFVLSRARAAGLPEAIQEKIDLVMEEVLLNVFHYAFEGAPVEPVAVGCGMIPDKGFLVRVIDAGLPFNPLEQPSPDMTLGIGEREIGGLGIFLTRELSRAMAYDRCDDHNVLDVYFPER
ncbi:ATP-binding protein [Desulfatitalea tepidiphila]|uniref:ATP-binding protein n=1 Tax=Desulfatitalea tepidiphila TaxID=1185843 RepID=UPI0006B481CE|nr:ATP-binding protein [Desulfatitalea tepidiphila]